MNVKSNSSDKIVKQSGTFDSLYIGAYLVHGTANTSIVAGDFDPSQVSVKLTVKRSNGTEDKIFNNDSLHLLGSFQTLDKGYNEFKNGMTLVTKDVAVKEQVLRFVRLEFGGHIRVNAGDIMTAEISVAKSGAFSANLDTALSYVEFEICESIGYQYGVPETRFIAITAGSPSVKETVGDNVTRLAMLNFDQTGIETDVVTKLGLQSDKLDTSYTFNQLLALNVENIPAPSLAKYSGVTRIIGYLPQCYLLHDAKKTNTELSKCVLDASFNSANVTQGQNYIAVRRFYTSKDMIKNAEDRRAKHNAERYSAVK